MDGARDGAASINETEINESRANSMDGDWSDVSSNKEQHCLISNKLKDMIFESTTNDFTEDKTAENICANVKSPQSAEGGKEDVKLVDEEIAPGLTEGGNGCASVVELHQSTLKNQDIGTDLPDQVEDSPIINVAVNCPMGPFNDDIAVANKVVTIEGGETSQIQPELKEAQPNSLTQDDTTRNDSAAFNKTQSYIENNTESIVNIDVNKRDPDITKNNDIPGNENSADCQSCNVMDVDANKQDLENNTESRYYCAAASKLESHTGNNQDNIVMGVDATKKDPESTESNTMLGYDSAAAIKPESSDFQDDNANANANKEDMEYDTLPENNSAASVKPESHTDSQDDDVMDFDVNKQAPEDTESSIPDALCNTSGDEVTVNTSKQESYVDSNVDGILILDASQEDPEVDVLSAASKLESHIASEADKDKTINVDTENNTLGADSLVANQPRTHSDSEADNIIDIHVNKQDIDADIPEALGNISEQNDSAASRVLKSTETEFELEDKCKPVVAYMPVSVLRSDDPLVPCVTSVCGVFEEKTIASNTLEISMNNEDCNKAAGINSETSEYENCYHMQSDSKTDDGVVQSVTEATEMIDTSCVDDQNEDMSGGGIDSLINTQEDVSKPGSESKTHSDKIEESDARRALTIIDTKFDCSLVSNIELNEKNMGDVVTSDNIDESQDKCTRNQEDYLNLTREENADAIDIESGMGDVMADVETDMNIDVEPLDKEKCVLIPENHHPVRNDIGTAELLEIDLKSNNTIGAAMGCEETPISAVDNIVKVDDASNTEGWKSDNVNGTVAESEENNSLTVKSEDAEKSNNDVFVTVMELCDLVEKNETIDTGMKKGIEIENDNTTEKLLREDISKPENHIAVPADVNLSENISSDNSVETNTKKSPVSFVNKELYIMLSDCIKEKSDSKSHLILDDGDFEKSNVQMDEALSKKRDSMDTDIVEDEPQTKRRKRSYPQKDAVDDTDDTKTRVKIIKITTKSGLVQTIIVPLDFKLSGIFKSNMTGKENNDETRISPRTNDDNASCDDSVSAKEQTADESDKVGFEDGESSKSNETSIKFLPENSTLGNNNKNSSGPDIDNNTDNDALAEHNMPVENSIITDLEWKSDRDSVTGNRKECEDAEMVQVDSDSEESNKLGLMCDICDREFSSESELIEHRSWHLESCSSVSLSEASEGVTLPLGDNTIIKSISTCTGNKHEAQLKECEMDKQIAGMSKLAQQSNGYKSDSISNQVLYKDDFGTLPVSTPCDAREISATCSTETEVCDVTKVLNEVISQVEITNEDCHSEFNNKTKGDPQTTPDLHKKTNHTLQTLGRNDEVENDKNEDLLTDDKICFDLLHKITEQVHNYIEGKEGNIKEQIIECYETPAEVHKEVILHPEDSDRIIRNEEVDIKYQHLIVSKAEPPGISTEECEGMGMQDTTVEDEDAIMDDQILTDDQAKLSETIIETNKQLVDSELMQNLNEKEGLTLFGSKMETDKKSDDSEQTQDMTDIMRDQISGKIEILEMCLETNHDNEMQNQSLNEKHTDVPKTVDELYKKLENTEKPYDITNNETGMQTDGEIDFSTSEMNEKAEDNEQTLYMTEKETETHVQTLNERKIEMSDSIETEVKECVINTKIELQEEILDDGKFDLENKKSEDAEQSQHVTENLISHDDKIEYPDVMGSETSKKSEEIQDSSNDSKDIIMEDHVLADAKFLSPEMMENDQITEVTEETHDMTDEAVEMQNQISNESETTETKTIKKCLVTGQTQDESEDIEMQDQLLYDSEISLHATDKRSESIEQTNDVNIQDQILSDGKVKLTGNFIETLERTDDTDQSEVTTNKNDEFNLEVQISTDKTSAEIVKEEEELILPNEDNDIIIKDEANVQLLNLSKTNPSSGITNVNDLLAPPICDGFYKDDDKKMEQHHNKVTDICLKPSVESETSESVVLQEQCSAMIGDCSVEDQGGEKMSVVLTESIPEAEKELQAQTISYTSDDQDGKTMSVKLTESIPEAEKELQAQTSSHAAEDQHLGSDKMGMEFPETVLEGENNLPHQNVDSGDKKYVESQLNKASSTLSLVENGEKYLQVESDDVIEKRQSSCYNRDDCDIKLSEDYVMDAAENEKDKDVITKAVEMYFLAEESHTIEGRKVTVATEHSASEDGKSSGDCELQDDISESNKVTSTSFESEADALDEVMENDQASVNTVVLPPYDHTSKSPTEPDSTTANHVEVQLSEQEGQHFVCPGSVIALPYFKLSELALSTPSRGRVEVPGNIEDEALLLSDGENVDILDDEEENKLLEDDVLSMEVDNNLDFKSNVDDSSVLPSKAGELLVESFDQHTCVVCENQLPDFISLFTHLEEHSSILKVMYECGKCQLSTTDEVYFDNHRCNHSGQHSSHIQDDNFCHECKAVFETPFKYESHMMSKHSTRNKCQFCSKTCLTFQGLLKHLQTHTSIEHPSLHKAKKEQEEKGKYTNCKLCNINFIKRESFELHMMEEHSSNNKCQFCNTSFTYLKSLVNHLRSHTKLPHMPYMCDKCGATFSKETKCLLHKCSITCEECGEFFESQDELTRHSKFHSMKLPSSVKTNVNRSKINVTKSVECSNCHKIFKSKQYFDIHTNSRICYRNAFVSNKEKQEAVSFSNIKSNTSCKKCKVKFETSDEFEHHMIDLHSSMNTCQFCDREFRHTQTLVHHLKEHTQIKPLLFYCNVCGLKFYQRQQLLNHDCFSEEPTCCVCSNTFTSPYMLASHLTQKHNVLKHLPVVCGRCRVHFGGSSQLGSHSCPLSTEKSEPYIEAFYTIPSEPVKAVPALNIKTECPHCSCIFESNVQLNQHLCDVFFCKHCHTACPTASSFETHMVNRHGSERTCQFCDRVFRSIQGLNKHISCHTRLKHQPTDLAVNNSNFCNMCDKNFVNRLIYEKHMMSEHCTLTVCQFCNKDFQTKSGLVSHLKTHTKLRYEFVSNCLNCKMKFSTQKQQREHKCSQPKINKNSKIAVNTKEASDRKHCLICNKSFPQVIAFQMHMLENHSLQAKCQFCGFTFKKKSGLLKHLQVHGILKCRQCNEFLPIKHQCNNISVGRKHKLSESANAETPEPPSKRAMRSDKKISTSSTMNAAKTIKCTLCQQLFADQQSVRSHLQDHHRVEVKSPLALAGCMMEELQEDSDDSMMSELTCLHCNHKFNSQAELRLHGQKARVYCDFCKRTFPSQGEYECHMLEDHSMDRTCQFCGAQFGSKTGLLLHLRKHTTMKPIFFKCFGCGDKFRTKQERQDHECVEWACETCGMKLPSEQELYKHRIIAHTKMDRTNVASTSKASVPQQQCEFCHKAFYTVDALEEHVKINHQIKTATSNTNKRHKQNTAGPLSVKRRKQEATGIPCDHCKLTFVSHAKLAYHKSCSCKTCGKVFTSPGLCIQHEAEHQPYQCGECGKKFTREAMFTKHIASHDEHKPVFRCEDCGRDFRSNMALKVHQRTHQVFQCELCTKAFPSAQKLSAHIRLHPPPVESAILDDSDDEPVILMEMMPQQGQFVLLN